MKRHAKQSATQSVISCKFTLLTALFSVLMTFLLPLSLLTAGRITPVSLQPAAAVLPRPASDVPDTRSAAPASSAGTAETPEPGTRDSAITLTVELNGKNRKMTMDQYLWGVVAAEMPAAFDLEALRAQAVAARTYTLYRMSHPSKHHPKAHICGDSGCCQAWISRKDRLAEWGKKGREEYTEKINQAVSSTDGLALYYRDEPILSAFHAASAGSTKSALEVWGEDYPYLQEVSSPEDEGSVPNYYSTVTVSKKEFSQLFLHAYPKADLSAPDCADWFGKVTSDQAGLPVSMEIGGVTADTGEIRTMFGLRSASFTVECQGDKITFYVTGYGHGVGMSQYGANALAKQGKTAEEILSWYYPGAELRQK